MNNTAAPITNFRSEAWLLMGLSGSTPGVLQLATGRLSLTVQGSGALGKRQRQVLEQRTGQVGLAERLARGESVRIFSQPLNQISAVIFPWYYFGGGAIVVVDGARYRLSFLQPQNTVVGVAGTGIVEGIRRGKVWKAALRILR